MRAAEPSAEVGELRARLDALEQQRKRDVRRIETLQAAVAVVAAVAPDEATVADESATQAMDVSREPGPAKHAPATHADEIAFFRQYYTSLDAIRDREARDVGWQDEVAKLARTAIDKEELFRGSRLTALACGSTLCRFEAEHPDDATAGYFRTLFHIRLGGKIPEASFYGEGLRTYGYLAREGHAIPVTDQSRNGS